jgi:lantibiotic modifying enzyme
MSWSPIFIGDESTKIKAVIWEIANALRDERRRRTLEPDMSHSPSLAGGNAGHALFFAYLDLAFPGNGFDEDTDALLSQAFAAVANQPLSWGLYSGVVGIGWVMAHLQSVGCKAAETYDLEELDEAFSQALGANPWRQDYDLISGLVGHTVYVLERPDSPKTRKMLAALIGQFRALSYPCEEGVTWRTPVHLVPAHQRSEFPNGWYNLGLAHGVPGVIGALSQIAVRTDHEKDTVQLLRDAIRWLRAQRLPEPSASVYPNWVADRHSPSPSRAAWCYGDPGVGTSLLLAGCSLDVPEWIAEGRDLMQRSSRRQLAGSGVIDAALCHGATGLAHLYNRAAQTCSCNILRTAASEWYVHALEMRRPNDGVAGFAYRAFRSKGWVWEPESGFLEGAAGIGLALLGSITDISPEWDRVLLSNTPRHALKSGSSQAALWGRS